MSREDTGAAGTDHAKIYDAQGREFVKTENVEWIAVDRQFFATHPSRFWYIREPMPGEIDAMLSVPGSLERDMVRIIRSEYGPSCRILVLVVQMPSNKGFTGRTRWPLPVLEHMKIEDITDPKVVLPDGTQLDPKQLQKYAAMKFALSQLTAAQRKGENRLRQTERRRR